MTATPLTTRGRPRNAHTRGDSTLGYVATWRQRLAMWRHGRLATVGHAVATRMATWLRDGYVPLPVRLWPTWVVALAMATAWLAYGYGHAGWRVMAAGLAICVALFWPWPDSGAAAQPTGQSLRADRKAERRAAKVATDRALLIAGPVAVANRLWLGAVFLVAASVAMLGVHGYTAVAIVALWLGGQLATWLRTTTGALAKRQARRLARLMAEGPKQIADRWAEQLSRPKGAPLPGTKLSGVEVQPDGSWWATLVVKSGSVTVEKVASNAAVIARVFDVRRDAVIVDEGKTEARIRLGVLRTNPLEAVSPFRGEPWQFMNRFGRWFVGLRADGERVFANLWRGDEGAVPGLVGGASRSGKSGPLQSLIGQGILSRKVVPVVSDPDANLRGVEGRVPVYATTPEESLRLIRAVHAVLECRKRNRVSSRAPSRTHPVLLAIFDEFTSSLNHPEFGKDFRYCAEDIARRGAKFNIAFYGAAQQPTVREIGKDNSTLRDQLMSGFVFVARLMSAAVAQSVLRDKFPAAYPERIPESLRGTAVVPATGGAMPSSSMQTRAMFWDAESWATFDRMDAEHEKPRAALEPAAQAAFDAVWVVEPEPEDDEEDDESEEVTGDDE